VCTGAEPLCFLDYLAVGRVVPERVGAIVAGVAEGCRRAGCALLGGETAEHPGVMAEDASDLAGFCVGVVDEDALLGPHRVGEGDVLVGLGSSGLHSNGYSLVRRVLLEEGGYELGDVLPRLGRSLADELLEPTAIYAPFVLELARQGRVHAAAHTTGGGLPENLLRAVPERFGAEVRRGSWPVPPIFDLIRETGEIADGDMLVTFNMGMGMVLVVPATEASSVVRSGASKMPVYEIGRIVREPGLHLV